MYDVLITKLRKVRKLYTKTRQQYPEVARQAKRNMLAIEKQLKLAKGRLA